MAVARLRAGVIAAAIFVSEILVGLERIGVKSDGVGVVAMSFDFFVVMVVRYEVRVVVTVEAIVCVRKERPWYCLTGSYSIWLE